MTSRSWRWICQVLVPSDAATLLVRVRDASGLLTATTPGDADQIAPSLYLKQRKRVQNTEAEPVVEVEPPTEAVVPAPAPPTTTEVVSPA